jgi:hypothetical protein
MPGAGKELEAIERDGRDWRSYVYLTVFYYYAIT